MGTEDQWTEVQRNIEQAAQAVIRERFQWRWCAGKMHACRRKQPMPALCDSVKKGITPVTPLEWKTMQSEVCPTCREEVKELVRREKIRQGKVLQTTFSFEEA